jgi:hypothetical protein
MATNDPLYPVFDLLEARLLDGCYIGRVDKAWWLFDEDGEGICTGQSIRELMVNLIMVEC